MVQRLSVLFDQVNILYGLAAWDNEIRLMLSYFMITNKE